MQHSAKPAADDETPEAPGPSVSGPSGLELSTQTLSAPGPWADALLASALFAIDPASMGGIAVKARSGPVRDHWFQWFKSLLPDGAPLRRVPTHADTSRLIGGLDLVATLRAGRPIAERGLLAEADGGVILLPNVERSDRQAVAQVTAAMDRGYIALERDGLRVKTPAVFGVIAFDEGTVPDEVAPAALTERLSFRVTFEGVSIREADIPAELVARVPAARQRFSSVVISDAIIADLCAVAMAFGIGSLRATLQAVVVARAAAALAGRTEVSVDDANAAVRLVLGPKAQQLPQSPDEESKQPDEQPDDAPGDHDGEDAGDEQNNTPDPKADEDRLVAAEAAVIPPDLLARLLADQNGIKHPKGSGRAGTIQRAKSRGRRAGSMPGDLNSGRRIDLVATLRAAAPWQAVRRRETRRTCGIDIRREDIRVFRFKAPAETATVFVVDASGSSALHRLGEAKGAIELMLADCYARRDSVALISFRGKSADVLLSPTRSLVKAKRNLAALPGGGGTPLASAIDAATELGEGLRRRGQSPVVVFLTDGRANVARDGSGSRVKGQADALQAARGFRASGVSALLIDTSPQLKPEAPEIASALGARYVALPHAGAEAISDAVRRTRTHLG